MLPFLLEALVKIALLVAGLMTAAAYLVLVERWIAAWVQDRLGPNRVGIPLTRIRLFGLGQPLADGVKLVTKEGITPSHVDKVVYYLAPVLIFTAALGVYAAIPFGSVLPEDIGIQGIDRRIQLVIAPGLDVGIVYVLAVASLSVYGVLLGSWASNSKYSFLGGLRIAAQLISYEIPMGLGVLAVVLMAGSLRLEEIILQQAGGVWNAFVQPLGFVVFMVAAFAESGRVPFDLYEAEQELVAGFHTEYSGVKLLMFLTAEFLHMVTAAFLATILFLGGWHLGGLTGSTENVTWLQAILRVAVLSAKVSAVILFFMLARWSWPRFRFDQLMSLAWKAILPLGLVNLVFVAAWAEYGTQISRISGLPSGAAMAVLGWAVLAISWLLMSRFGAETDNRPHLESVDGPGYEEE